MEVSALKYQVGVGRYGRSPWLRLQSDDHLIKLIRAGHDGAFEALVSRHESRLLSFCRHLLGSREDAEDVLQDALSAAYNAIRADERPINVRPWLYRIARNRCLNQLRQVRAIGVDSMDVLYAENGETTADKVHQREEFRLLLDDIHDLPETQRTALILREMDALSYEQIAEAMETTVSSVKSLLVRARVSLAEASQARLLSCEEVRSELASVAEGLIRRPGTLERRHLRNCERCAAFNQQLKRTNRALGALLPVGPLALLKTGIFSHASAATGSATASSPSLIGAGIGALGTKAAAGLAVAALVTAGAVVTSDPDHSGVSRKLRTSAAAPVAKRAGADAFSSRIPVAETATAVSSSALTLGARNVSASRQTKFVLSPGSHGSTSAPSAVVRPTSASADGPAVSATTPPAAAVTNTTASATTARTPPATSPGATLAGATLAGATHTPVLRVPGSGGDGTGPFTLTTAATALLNALPESSATAPSTTAASTAAALATAIPKVVTTPTRTAP